MNQPRCVSEDALHYPFLLRGDVLAPELRDLVSRRPVERVVTNTGDPAWLVTGYHLVRTVLADRRFSLSETSNPEGLKQDPFVSPPVVTGVMALLQRAGARGDFLRGLSPTSEDAVLTPTRVAERTREVLADLCARGQPGDLVGDFTMPLATRLACELFGLPVAEALDADTWIATLCTGSEGADHVIGKRCMRCAAWMAQQIQRSRYTSRGLVSRLVRRMDRGANVSEEDMVNALSFLYVSFLGNTASTLSAVSLLLLDHPTLAQRLRANDDLFPQAVEELLRRGVVLGDGIARIAKEEVRLGDVLVRAGDLVLVSTDAANQDPSVFPAPERLDIDRARVPHLRFGYGRHHCPGAALGRMQTDRVLRTLLTELPGLRLAGSAADVSWRPHRAITLPVTLPVRW